MARAVEVQMYQLFYDSEELPTPIKLGSSNGDQWGTSGRDSRYLFKLRNALARMNPDDRNLLLYMTQRMATRNR
jgi:hypothetical protein